MACLATTTTASHGPFRMSLKDRPFFVQRKSDPMGGTRPHRSHYVAKRGVARGKRVFSSGNRIRSSILIILRLGSVGCPEWSSDPLPIRRTLFLLIALICFFFSLSTPIPLFSLFSLLTHFLLLSPPPPYTHPAIYTHILSFSGAPYLRLISSFVIPTSASTRSLNPACPSIVKPIHSSPSLARLRIPPWIPRRTR